MCWDKELETPNKGRRKNKRTLRNNINTSRNYKDSWCKTVYPWMKYNSNFVSLIIGSRRTIYIYKSTTGLTIQISNKQPT